MFATYNISKKYNYEWRNSEMAVKKLSTIFSVELKAINFKSMQG